MLTTLQKTILPQQKRIIRYLLVLEIALLLGWMLTAILVTSQPRSVLPITVAWGGRLGVISVVLFVLTLVPGIIIRLKPRTHKLLPIATIITPFRRHMGILMFLVAFVHMSFTTTLTYVAFNGWQALPPPLELFHIVGSVAWLLLLPVWLTSNDFSVKKLGTSWKRLQRLTYLALWFIFVHVAMQSHPIALLLLVAGVLELYSWFVGCRTSTGSV